MKYKIFILLLLLFTSIIVSAQFPNTQTVSNPNTIYQPNGALKGKLAFMLPIVDTLNNKATPYPGSLTIRPQDTVQNDPPVYMSNGRYWNRFMANSSFLNFITYKLPGGYLIYDTLMDFHVTPAQYYILGRYFTSPLTAFTLAPTNPSAGRIDVPYADTNSVVGYIQGVNGGGKPTVNPSSQIELGEIVLNGGDVSPPYIYNVPIYKWDLGWTGTSDVSGIDFAYTTNPRAGSTISVLVPSFTDGQYINFNYGASLNIANGAFLKFYIRQNATMTGSVNFTFMDGANPISNSVVMLNGLYGYTTSTLNSYIEVDIPFNQFVFTSNTFDNIQIGLNGTNAGSFQLSEIQLQYGGAAPSSTTGSGVITFNTRDGNVNLLKTDNQWWYDSTALNFDSTYYINYANNVIVDSIQTLLVQIFSDTCLIKTDTIINSKRGIYISLNPYCNGTTISPIITLEWSVLDSLSTPVGSPSQGDIYLVGTSPTGAFTGEANNIAVYDTTAGYSFSTATVGDLLYNATTQQVSQWTGSAWVWVSVNGYVHIQGAETILGKKSFADTLILLSKPIKIKTQNNVPVSLLVTEVIGSTGEWLQIQGNSSGSKINMGANNSSSPGTSMLRIVGDYTDSIVTGQYRPLWIDAYEQLRLRGDRVGTSNDTAISFNTGSSAYNYVGWFGRLGAFYLPKYVSGTIPTGTAAYTLQVDATGKVIGGAVGSSITASNGLTLTGSDVTLEGTLTKNTAIATGAFTTTFSTATSAINPFKVTSTTGTAILVNATTGSAFSAVTSGGLGLNVVNSSGQAIYGKGTNAAAIMQLEAASANSLTLSNLQLYRTTTSTAANDIGQSLDFVMETSDGTSANSNQFVSKWSDATTATRTSKFILTGVNSAVAADLLTISGSGATQLNKYGIGTFTGTPAYTLQVDASGNLIEGTIGSGVAWGAITGTLSDQTDLNTALGLKAPLASPTFTGTVTMPTPFTLGAVSVLPTGTELNFVDGVTSAIQTQLDARWLTNSASADIMQKNSQRFIHTTGANGGGDVNENTFVGYKAGNAFQASSTGYANTVVGKGAALLLDGTAPAASSNTIMGYGSFAAATTASFNTALGTATMTAVTTEQNMTALGYHAMLNATGANSTAVGAFALRSNTAVNTTALGFEAMYSNTSGTFNTAFGNQALRTNTTGTANTAIGYLSLYNTSNAGALGFDNTAVGSRSFTANTTGYINTAVGADAGFTNTTGYANTFIGRNAGYSNLTGFENVYVGSSANSTGTGSDNIVIGKGILTPTTSDNNKLNIGGVLYGSNLYNSTTGMIGIQINDPTAYLHLPASILGRAALRFQGGITPTTLNNGDMWFDSTTNHFLARINGTSYQLDQQSVGTVSLSTANIFTTNGAVSAPSQTFNGTWYSGGSTTTTKPMLLLEPSGATSSNWNANGTGLGINGASGSTADLLNIQLNAAARFKIASTGAITANSSLTITGDIISAGNIYRSSSNGVITIYNDGGGATGIGLYGSTHATLANRIKFTAPNGVGIGADPTSTLHINGSFSAGYVAKTATYTATISDYTIECTANTFTVTLPTAVGITGRIYNIVNSGAGTITVGTTSSQTFVNVVATPTTLTMAAVGSVMVQSNGANWMQLK